jgi:hypothetical protein
MKDLMTGRPRRAGPATAGAIRRTGALAGVMTAVAALAAVAAPSALAATAAAHAQLSPESSRRVTVTNLSQYTLKLVKVEGDKRFEGRPADGSTIAPGYSQHFEVQYVYLSTQRDRAFYNVFNSSGTKVGTFEAYMTLASNGYSDPVLSVDCSAYGTGTSCSKDGNTIKYLGSGTITVSDSAAQGAIIGQLCGTTSATCSFDPASQQSWHGPQHQSGPAYGNDTSTPITKKITVTEKVTATQTVEVTGTAKATFGKIVELSISAKYGKTQAAEHTYTEETDLIPPKTKIWPVVEDPLVTYTGTFTITLGNTTWNLPNLAVTYPNLDGFPTITWKEAPI